MELLIVIIKKIELIDDIIRELKASDIHHGTIVDAKSMTTALTNWSDVPMFGLFRNANNYEYNEDCRMMRLVLNEEQTKKVREIVERVVGNMNTPKTAVMFSIPISFWEGIGN